MRTGKRGKGNTAGTMEGKAKSGGKVVALGTTGKPNAKATPTGSTSKSARPAAGPTHAQIAKRAEVIWQKRGRVTGQDEQNWHEAEAQLKAELGIE
jgi:DUF2934 family protein